MALTTVASVLDQIRLRSETKESDLVESREQFAEVLRGIADELAPSAPLEPMLDIAAVSVVGVSENLRIVFLNRGARQLLGDDAMHRPVLDVLMKSSEEFRETLEEEEAASSELAFLEQRRGAADENWHCMEWHLQVLPEPQDHIAVLITGFEVTERVRRETQLRDSERQLFDICNSIPALVAYIDAEERFQFTNAAYEWVLGLSPMDLRGRSIHEVLDQESLEASAPYRSRVLTGVATSYETQLYDRQGELLDAVVRYTPHFNASGEVGGFISLTTDITEFKKLERALRHSQKMEALGRFASGCAHEFNNLMMGISGCANVALSRLGENDPSRLLLEEIRGASTGGASISRQLLNFSHGEESDLVLVDVGSTIKAHATMIKCLVGANVEVRLDLNAEDAKVLLVQGELEQVLLNLIVNARDAMAEGGKLVVQTSNEQVDATEARRRGSISTGPYVHLKVVDTGTGMDAATVERIFDPFFTTKPIGGTGLGLSAVYGTVSKAGGMLEVDSNLGEGTGFSIWLPRVVSDSRALVAETPSDEDGSDVEGADKQTAPTVLLVEDDRLVRMTVRYQLTSGGFHVIEADTGTAALERARTHAGAIDLLVTDMVLPGVSGAEVAKQVRQLHPEVIVLGMSAHSPAMLSRAGNLDPNMEILQKPFSGDDLLLRVSELLEEGHTALRPSLH